MLGSGQIKPAKSKCMKGKEVSIFDQATWGAGPIVMVRSWEEKLRK